MSAKEKARSRAVEAAGSGLAMTDKANFDDTSRLEANVREVRRKVLRSSVYDTLFPELGGADATV